MSPIDYSQSADPAWLQRCTAAGLDPLLRLQARLATLGHAQSLDCTLYRPDEDDFDAEETELGDARVLLAGDFKAPADWSENQRAEFFGEDDPVLFFNAVIECVAAVGSKAFFIPETGDHLASISVQGEVVMYFVHDCREDDTGLHCVLIREDELLD